ncbi:hypothetical protein WG66_005827 [Moniliophthora roreri]|nr:hypothetical protein WG66_005827 [Moniliophthora roreri]
MLPDSTLDIGTPGQTVNANGIIYLYERMNGCKVIPTIKPERRMTFKGCDSGYTTNPTLDAITCT